MVKEFTNSGTLMTSKMIKSHLRLRFSHVPLVKMVEMLDLPDEPGTSDGTSKDEYGEETTTRNRRRRIFATRARSYCFVSADIRRYNYTALVHAPWTYILPSREALLLSSCPM